jgi:hypothetical protein
MRIHAILNRNAGTIIGGGGEVFERKLTETFTNAGHDITVGGDKFGLGALCGRVDG